MPDTLKVFEKCRDTKCGDVFTKKELNESKKQYKKNVKEKCRDEKDKTNKFMCSFKLLKKSKYNKLLGKRAKCAEIKCKKEREIFRKDFFKRIKEFKKRSKKNMKPKSNKKTKKKSNKKSKKNSKKSVYNKKK